MPSWKDKIGRERYYSKDFEGRDDIVTWEVTEIEPEQLIKFTFVSTNSKDTQGVRLAIDAGDGYLEIDGVKGRSMELWQDTAPREIICKCVSSSGLLSVYNTWRRQDGNEFSFSYGAGMLLEEEGRKRVYRCNDWGIETNFDKLVFAIERL